MVGLLDRRGKGASATDGQMIVVNVHDAKTRLSQLLDRAQTGEEIVIVKAGRPIAKLVGLGRGRTRRKPGLLKGEIRACP